MIRLVVLAALLCGCANSYDAAQQSRGAISRAIDESVGAWKAYDNAKQNRIASEAPTKEAAHAALDSYRKGEQAVVVKVINAAWAALVGLDKALALWNAGQKGGLPAALATAYASIADVAQALTGLGIPIGSVR